MCVSKCELVISKLVKSVYVCELVVIERKREREKGTSLFVSLWRVVSSWVVRREREGGREREREDRWDHLISSKTQYPVPPLFTE